MSMLGRMFKRGGDEPEMIQRMRAGAEAGDVVAQRGLGGLYFDGKLVRQDYTEAARWYAMAATHDDERALFVLGEMHVRGLGVATDLEIAQQLLARAAERGHVPAQISLAALLDSRGLHAEANGWWECAANSGHAAAAYNLGCSYSDGVGTDRDRAHALFWFKRAAELGHADALARATELADQK